MYRSHVCGCPQRPEDGFGSPRTGVRGRCEPPDVTELRVGVQLRSISDLCSCVFNNRDVLLTSGKQPRALATKGLDTQGPRQYLSLFWRLGLSLIWSSQVTWAGWSASPGNPPFCLPWAGITRVWHDIFSGLFLWILGLTLMPAQQALHHLLSNLCSP